MSKDLADKAIDIKGKQYVLVSDRIIYFNETYPNGSIETKLISEPNSDIVTVKAIVTPDETAFKDGHDMRRGFTGYSQAVKGAGFINKTAALENAETSAVGRALAMMGIGVIDSVASVDEINKAQGTDPDLAKAKSEVLYALISADIKGFDKQVEFIESVLQKTTIDSVREAEQVIKALEDSNEVG